MVKQFKEKQGVIYNPYIGFTSFQHFRGEALYSDCITGRNGIASCETENYECYPVPAGVEEKGREQGWYPDTTVAYIRILWKEFEPEQGKYNYDFIQGVLDKAKEKGQTVMFRLMPHSTCERDDVPDWLKKIMPCPARPAGMQVKDSPTDPRYLKLFGLAVEKFGERFDSDPTLDCVDVSIGGAWGEGSQDFPIEAMHALMDIYVKVFPNTKLVGQFANDDLLHYIGAKRAIGWRADGTGSPRHMNELFPASFGRLKKEFWKTGPISFESYWWISEWKRQGWDIDAIIAQTLEWHLSTFNTKSFPIPYEWKDKIENWLIKMGYRFVLTELDCADAFTAGGEEKIVIKGKNAGVAPIYNRLPLTLRLKGEGKTYDIATNVNVTEWLPGDFNEEIKIAVPKDADAGEYELSLAIGGGNLPFVTLANEGECEDGYFKLADIKISK